MNLKERIFLIGMPGSGKSTVGKRLADRLGFAFLDLDALVVEREGDSIAHIFESRGEAYFRGAEAAALRSLDATKGGVVLATGGGAPCFLGNMGYMLGQGLTVYLKLAPEALIKRFTEEELSVRPLLKNKSESQLLSYLSETLAHRAQFYEQAQVVIEVEGISVETTVLAIEKQVLPHLGRL